ncbi:MAG: ArsR/SmtB family transcription factor [Anaerolineae bacterium]
MYTPTMVEVCVSDHCPLIEKRGMEREALASVLKALGDPTRLQIFDALVEGVHCNCEIAERLGRSLSLISYHLRVLQQVDLIEGVQANEDARWIYYSVNRDRLVELGAEIGRLLDVNRVQPRLPSCGPAKLRRRC